MIPFIKPLPGSGNHLQDQKDDELEEESRREDEIDEAEYKIEDR
jgi:hypothetical protein